MRWEAELSAFADETARDSGTDRETAITVMRSEPGAVAVALGIDDPDLVAKWCDRQLRLRPNPELGWREISQAVGDAAVSDPKEFAKLAYRLLEAIWRGSDIALNDASGTLARRLERMQRSVRAAQRDLEG